VKAFQKEWLEVVQDLIGLWDRFDTLYLRGVTPDEVNEERENEYLQFQGAMVEQLVKVIEIGHNRFDVHDLVMAVVHDSPSLRSLCRHSDFQRKRLQQRWGEASEALSKLRHFCETYTPKLDKTTRLEKVRRLNPFWNPAGGGFQSTLIKLVNGPVTFFAGLRPGAEEKTGWFLFKVGVVPALIVMLVVAIVHFQDVKEMGWNFGETTGLVPERGGFVPTLVIFAFALLTIVALALAATVAFMILVSLHVVTLHAAFRLFGARNDIKMTRKLVVYGAGPIVAIITAPYAIVLQIIGAHKTQKIAPVLAPFAWLIGTALLAAIVFGVMLVTYELMGQVPNTGEYVEPLRSGVQLYEAAPLEHALVRPSRVVGPGEHFEYKGHAAMRTSHGGEADYYHVTIEGRSFYLPVEDGEIKRFSYTQLPWFLLKLTRDKIVYGLNELCRITGAQPD
jgi:hypothetical protein